MKGQHQRAGFLNPEPLSDSVPVPRQNQACLSSGHLVGKSTLHKHLRKARPLRKDSWLLVRTCLVPTSFGVGHVVQMGTAHLCPCGLGLWGGSVLWSGCTYQIPRHAHLELVSCCSLNPTSSISFHLTHQKMSHKLSRLVGVQVHSQRQAPHLVENEYEGWSKRRKVCAAKPGV